ncbi:hypothetical protein GALMADRAFT_256383 [Galerina marginata CBS 339.88]|uniref:Uncharacterized protein n=1 Tax=Galerina marginata (strain CBS 339.88) TaxID=685588 RepID=A0A067SD80_GALM3|nr:hypothetical protein GALMADRAFT_256383 [Galerina marginata CBS 339.88]
MSAPPVPPRPYETTNAHPNHNLNPNPSLAAPPPLPPFPDLRLQTARYNTLSQPKPV